MKVQHHKADAFIQSLPQDCVAALLYGPDVGLIHQRLEAISKCIVEDLNDPFNVIDIDPDALKQDPARLADEIAAVTFGGGRKLIRLKDAGNGTEKLLKDAIDVIGLKAAVEQCFVVITAGELSPKSGLRAFFEKEPYAASLPCYQDEGRDLVQIVQEDVRKRGKSIDFAAAQYISASCKGDRMVVLSTLEKLDLYTSGKSAISLDDAIHSVGVTTETEYEDIAVSMFSGNQKMLSQHLQKAFAQGTMPIAVTRVMQREALKLQWLVSEVHAGESVDGAVKKLRPPVFFKQVPIVKDRIARWVKKDAKKLNQVIETLYDLELSSKRTGSNPELLSQRYFMKVAAIAAR